ncbi:MAG: hypothetical protein ACTSRB_17915, partial [Candidatus Helarchaeota archaeon]
KWDNKYGAKMHSKHPNDLEISDDQTMSIYTFHSMGGLKSGFMAIKREDLNVASYFLNITETGDKYFLAILFEENEDPNLFEKKLTDIAQDLWQRLLDPKIENKEITEQLSAYYTELLKDQVQQLNRIKQEQDRQLLILRDQVNKQQFELDKYRNNSEIVRDFKNGSLEDKFSKLRKENLEMKTTLRQNELKIRELKSYNETLKRDLVLFYLNSYFPKNFHSK